MTSKLRKVGHDHSGETNRENQLAYGAVFH